MHRTRNPRRGIGPTQEADTRPIDPSISLEQRLAPLFPTRDATRREGAPEEPREERTRRRP